MLEWDDLLDGHLVAGHRVGGRGHHAVGPLPQELQIVVPRADLKDERLCRTQMFLLRHYRDRRLLEDLHSVTHLRSTQC